MANVRYWMRELSRIARNTRRPAKVSWVDNDNLNLACYQINIPAYYAAVRNTLRKLVKHVEEKVLMGINVDWLEIPATENMDFATRGYGLFTGLPPEDGSETRMENPDSDRFFAEVLKAGKLCQFKDGALVFDRRQCQTWSSDIDIAWLDAYRVYHLVSLPGRGTEEAQWTPENTGPTRRHLINVKGTLAFLSNYHKGAFSSGIYKEILRLVPYTLAYIMAILGRLTRPVEMVTLAMFMGVSDEEREAIRYTYRTHVFASFGREWDSNKLSNAIKSWFRDNLNVPIGMNLHRHLAQALQRKYLSYDGKKNNMATTANAMLGHGDEAGEMNYAVEKGASLPISRAELFVNVCVDYIGLYGISTFKGVYDIAVIITFSRCTADSFTAEG